MFIFSSEEDLLSTLKRHDQLFIDCITEKITFQEFLDKYNDFYAYYALDGHESDTEEQNIFEKNEHRILPHREIFEMLNGLCSDEDTEKELYIKAKRFGSKEALNRLKQIGGKHFSF